MNHDKQKWLTLEADDGWQMIVPDYDSNPHSTDTHKTSKQVAGLDCPCKPKVNSADKVIIHNSFIDEKRISESMKRIAEMYEKPEEDDAE